MNVGDLQNSRLDRLDVIAQTRRGDDDRRVCSARDVDFVLPDADRLDDDELVARRVEHVDSFERPAREPAERTPGRHAAHVHSCVAREIAHADSIAEDRAAAERTRRIDCHDRDLAGGPADRRSELRDQRRLAAPRNAGDADDVCAAGVLENRVERSAGFLGSGLRAGEEPGDRADLARENARDEIERGNICHRQGLEIGARECPGRHDLDLRAHAEELLQLPRGVMLERMHRRIAGCADSRRGLDANDELVHRALARDDDPVLAAVTRELVDDGVDFAGIDVLAANGEHIVDAAENAVRQSRVGAAAGIGPVLPEREISRNEPDHRL